MHFHLGQQVGAGRPVLAVKVQLYGWGSLA
jgi:hypothetical protein